MKAFKACTFVVSLLALLALGGCATTGPETTITGFQKISSFENKKVTLSLPVVVEKDMETKKNPDATEKTVANEVYANLKKNLAHKDILSQEQGNNVLDVQLNVHYVNRTFAEWEYFGSKIFTERKGGGQIVVARAILKRSGVIVTYINAIDNTGTMRDRQPVIQGISAELTAQIEKILKEGVAVGKSP